MMIIMVYKVNHNPISMLKMMSVFGSSNFMIGQYLNHKTTSADKKKPKI